MTAKVLSEFSLKVIAHIKKIPKGRVASYSQIAALAGKPHASRGVAWILHSCSTSHRLPWHRVLNAKGKIAFPPSTANFTRQKNRLQKEGVRFTSVDTVDLAKCRWRARPKPSRGPKMFS